MAGEGLFTKRYLPKGSLVALFNGVRKREVNGVVSQTSAYKIGIDLFVMKNSSASGWFIHFLFFHAIGLTRTVDLDIPDGVESAQKYYLF